MPIKNNRNNKQDQEITAIKTDIRWLKKTISKVEKQVFNEIPHQIEDLDSKMDEFSKSLYKRPSWLVSAVITILTATLTGLVIYFLTRVI